MSTEINACSEGIPSMSYNVLITGNSNDTPLSFLYYETTMTHISQVLHALFGQHRHLDANLFMATFMLIMHSSSHVYPVFDDIGDITSAGTLESMNSICDIAGYHDDEPLRKLYDGIIGSDDVDIMIPSMLAFKAVHDVGYDGLGDDVEALCGFIIDINDDMPYEYAVESLMMRIAED